MSPWVAAFIGGLVGGFITGIWQGYRYDWMVTSYQSSMLALIAERDFWHGLASKEDQRLVAAAEAVLGEYDLQDEYLLELDAAVKASRGQPS